MFSLDILCLPAWHLPGMDVAWSYSHSEAKSQVDDSERIEKLANVWWSPKGAKLGEMAQCGWKSSPFLPLWGAEVMEGITKDAAASSSMFMAGVSHPWAPSPSSFLILSRNSWCLTHSGSWDYLNDFQIYWDPQKNTYMLTLRCSPNPAYNFKGVHRQHSLPPRFQGWGSEALSQGTCSGANASGWLPPPSTPDLTQLGWFQPKVTCQCYAYMKGKQPTFFKQIMP